MSDRAPRPDHGSPREPGRKARGLGIRVDFVDTIPVDTPPVTNRESVPALGGT